MITESDESVFEQLKVNFEESQKIKGDYGVLIGGSHLPQIFENKENSDLFLKIIDKSKSIIAYRLSPS
jgi:hypothetical protein